MKRYKYEEWNVKDDEGLFGGFDDRTYIDFDGNLLTGILEGFYFFPDTEIEDDKNSQYVENGKRK